MVKDSGSLLFFIFVIFLVFLEEDIYLVVFDFREFLVLREGEFRLIFYLVVLLVVICFVFFGLFVVLFFKCLRGVVCGVICFFVGICVCFIRFRRREGFFFFNGIFRI